MENGDGDGGSPEGDRPIARVCSAAEPLVGWFTHYFNRTHPSPGKPPGLFRGGVGKSYIRTVFKRGAPLHRSVARKGLSGVLDGGYEGLRCAAHPRYRSAALWALPTQFESEAKKLGWADCPEMAQGYIGG